MSGVYDWARRPDEPPRPNPVGALGDISSGLFAVIGILAALRHRDATGEGQHIDIAMLDALLSMTDVVTNLWSLGLRPDKPMPLILDAFAAKDGFVVTQIVREHQFEALASLIGREEWLDDARFADRQGWGDHLESEIRPAVEAWMATRTRLEATEELSAAGIAAGPCTTAPEVIADPHVAVRNMLVEMPRTDGGDEPVLIPGNPVKMSDVAEGPETRIPWVGEHTDEVLTAELGLAADRLARLRSEGVIT
jgi:crotonobetainyl-CoA:carnitine CoA-transferase CaiB-like acyl-CoA transferase